MAFLDLEKAFDSVLQQTVWDSLRSRNVNERLLAGIRSLYENNRSYVRKDNRSSETFPIKDGLRQGGVMSPTLFIIVMDDIIKATKLNSHQVNIGYHRLQPVSIGECAFADDIMICTSTETHLQEKLIQWTQELKRRGLKINVQKTKVMHIGKESKSIEVKINEDTLEQVDSFKYLGVIIDREGNMEEEIQERIQNATKLYHSLNKAFINKKEISSKTKLTVHKTIFRPILTYGSESWITSKSSSSRIQAIDMKFLRRIKGVTRLDRIPNTSIREELGVEGTDELVARNKLKWFGHINRMEEGRPVKKVWQARPQKARLRGRPRKTWDDDVGNIFNAKGVTWNDAKRMATNKKEWTRFVYAAN